MILCILKGILPFKMHRIILFPENLKKNPFFFIWPNDRNFELALYRIFFFFANPIEAIIIFIHINCGVVICSDL